MAGRQTCCRTTPHHIGVMAPPLRLPGCSTGWVAVGHPHMHVTLLQHKIHTSARDHPTACPHPQSPPSLPLTQHTRTPPHTLRIPPPSLSQHTPTQSPPSPPLTQHKHAIMHTCIACTHSTSKLTYTLMSPPPPPTPTPTHACTPTHAQGPQPGPCPCAPPAYLHC